MKEIQDKVYDAYYFKFGNEFGQKVRERVHWIVQNTKGNEILEIGCSQGIVSILLGREGKNVLGIDVSESSIQEAKNNLEKEEEETKQLVQFEKANFFLKEFDKQFDVVILGEVLEHISDIHTFFQKVVDVTKDDGTIIVTTPFGINEFIDHKRTFYLHEFFNMQKFSVAIKNINFFGKWIGVIYQKNLEKLDIDSNLLLEFESAIYNLERDLLDKIKSCNSRINELNKQLKNEIKKQNKIKELHAEKNKENEEKIKKLENEILEYETLLESAIKQRDKNINYLRKRVTVLEQSTLYRCYFLLKPTLKRPWLLPKRALMAARIIAGSIKWKLLGRKRKYRLVPLPYEISPVPLSLKNKEFLDEDISIPINIGLNPLFIVGLMDSPKKLSDLRVALIGDDAALNSFKFDCEVFYIKPDNWKEIMTINKPHFLIVDTDSLRHGFWEIENENNRSVNHNKLMELLDWCEENKIYSNLRIKTNFEINMYKELINKFSFVYVSEKKDLLKYKELIRKDNVFHFPAAVQPRLFNPIRIDKYREKNILYIGTYDSNEVDQEKKLSILEVSKKFGLDIFDLNYDYKGLGAENKKFPDSFMQNITSQKANSKNMNLEYKKYKAYLNLNNERLFEVLASGVLVLSERSSEVISNIEDILLLYNEKDDLKSHLENIVNNLDEFKGREIRGQRLIFDNYTSAHLLHNIANNCGYKIEEPYTDYVHVVSVVDSIKYAENVYTSFNNQKFTNKKITIFIREARNESIEGFEEANIVYLDDENRGTIANMLANIKNESQYIAYFHPEHYYGPNYLIDLVHAFIYADADAVGKLSYYSYDKKDKTVKLIEENTDNIYTTKLRMGSIVIKSESVDKFGLSIEKIFFEPGYLTQYTQFGLRLYATNSYNYIENVDQEIYIKEDILKIIDQ